MQLTSIRSYRHRLFESTLVPEIPGPDWQLHPAFKSGVEVERSPCGV